MRIERDVGGGNVGVGGCGRDRKGVESSRADATPDRSATFLAGLRERLRSEILAIEHRGRGNDEDDPQARRWLDRARRVRRQEPDPIGAPWGEIRAHSLQERDPERPSVSIRTDRAETRSPPHAGLPTGWTEIDVALGGWPLGTIHELFGIEWDGPVCGAHRTAPSSTPSSMWIPPMGVAIRLASAALRGIGGGIRTEGEPALPRRGVLWVGRAIRPDPGALRRDGDPQGGTSEEADLISRSFFLDAGEDPVGPQAIVRSSARPGGRAGPVSVRMQNRTWAIEQAIRHEAFAAIVADARGMTIAESRRLQVAASDRSLPLLILLLREAREVNARSVAGFRWRVESCPGGHAADGSDRGEPDAGWRLRLMRGRVSLPPEVRRTIESDAGLSVRIKASPEDPLASWTSGRGPERVPQRCLAPRSDRAPWIPARTRHGPPGAMPAEWSMPSCVG